MLTRLWTIGVKVAELEQELAFHRRIGHDIVLDETVTVNERTFRVVLLRMGDKCLHLFDEAVYEDQLAEPLAPGPCHIVYISEDFELDIADIRSAGVHLLFPLTTIKVDAIRLLPVLRGIGYDANYSLCLYDNQLPRRAIRQSVDYLRANGYFVA